MIALLCRGMSLKRYKDMSHMFSKVYLCGRFYKEIRKIGKEHFVGKEIIHVVGRGQSQLRNNYYKKLKVKYVQTTSHSIKKQFCKDDGRSHRDKYPMGIEVRKVPTSLKGRGFPPLSFEVLNRYAGGFNDYKDMCSFLEQSMPKEIKKVAIETRRTRFWPTTGLFGLDLVLNTNDIDKIYIFGLDLYTTLTYARYKSMAEEFTTTIRSDRTELCFYHLKQLIKEFPLVEFCSAAYTNEFKFNFSNWRLI